MENVKNVTEDEKKTGVKKAKNKEAGKNA